VELRRTRRAILERIAATARQPGGLDASTLEAASALAPAGMPALRVDHLPEAPASLLELARAGRYGALALAATRALALRGPREDLLCLRGVARAARADVGRAAQDWEQALKLAPSSRCARLNLATLAIWTRDHARGDRLLAGLDGEPALLGRAASALGSGKHREAAGLAREALAQNPRSSATCLLGVLLVDHLGDPKAAAPLLRACVDAKLGSSALARERLARLRRQPQS
jgi:tetratricopeptide (TPR) repeat protein